MAQLADALVLGTSFRKDVWVRVPPGARETKGTCAFRLEKVASPFPDDATSQCLEEKYPHCPLAEGSGRINRWPSRTIGFIGTKRWRTSVQGSRAPSPFFSELSTQHSAASHPLYRYGQILLLVWVESTPTALLRCAETMGVLGRGLVQVRGARIRVLEARGTSLVAYVWRYGRIAPWTTDWR